MIQSNTSVITFIINFRDPNNNKNTQGIPSNTQASTFLVFSSISEGDWTVQVKTGDLPNSGTSANVFLTVCGTEHSSQPLPLSSSDAEAFAQGKLSEFRVSLAFVKIPYESRTTTENTLRINFVYIFSILHSVQSYENKIVLSCLVLYRNKQDWKWTLFNKTRQDNIHIFNQIIVFQVQNKSKL